MHAEEVSPWFFKCSNQENNSARRLFCFPFAGGGISTYTPWAKYFKTDAEVFAAQLPGRGTRFSEAPIAELQTLIGSLAQAISPLMDRPCVFFGHSMGAILAYELCLKLHREDRTLPSILMLSACSPPHIQAEKPGPLHTLPSAEFWQAVRAINGTPSEVLKNTELLALIEPALRADFKIACDWRQQNNTSRPVLPVSLKLFGGLQDKSVSRENLSAWGDYSLNTAQSQMLKGDHFFINDAESGLLPLISGSLLSIG